MSINSKIKTIISLFRKKEKIPIPRLISEEQLLCGKTALISGGSGGIGRAIAEEFINRGCHVIIAGTNEAKMRNICNEIGSDNISFVSLNLYNIDTFPNIIKEVCGMSPSGIIDILVNCAGINNSETFLNVTEKEYDNMMDINVKGTYFLSQSVAKHMIENKVHGHILNLSSASSLRPASQPYAISKWAITGMTKGLADVLIKHGITVNSIAPGPTATPMLGKSQGDDINHESSPIGRYALPEEIARLASFMVSDLGDLIIGDTFYISGGSGTTSLHK